MFKSIKKEKEEEEKEEERNPFGLHKKCFTCSVLDTAVQYKGSPCFHQAAHFSRWRRRKEGIKCPKQPKPANPIPSGYPDLCNTKD